MLICPILNLSVIFITMISTRICIRVQSQGNKIKKGSMHLFMVWLAKAITFSHCNLI